MAYTGSSAAMLASYDEALKYMYLPAMQEYLNGDTILADKIDVNEKDVSGKKAYIENHYGRSAGIGARADGGALPNASFQKFKKSEVSTKYNYGRVNFSGPTIAATRDERGAYAKVVQSEIEGITKDLMKDINRQLWGAGYGIISRWRTGSDGSSGSQWTVQKKYCNNSAGGDGFGSTFGSKYIDDWAYVSTTGITEQAGYNTILPTWSSGITATTLTSTVLLFPLTGSISAATDGTYVTLGTTHTDPGISEVAGTFLVRLGNGVSLSSTSAAGAGRLEMMGIRGIVTDSNLDDISFINGGAVDGFAASVAEDVLQGIDVDTYAWFKSQVLAASGGRYTSQRQLTPKLMQQMFDKVELKAGKDYGPDMIITTHAIRREYLDYMEARRRTVNTMTLDGGWTAIDYNGVPLMVDPDAIDGEMYFLTLKDLQLYRMSDYDFMDRDGAILSRITGYDAYEAVLYRYAELGVNNRASHGVICDLAYDPD